MTKPTILVAGVDAVQKKTLIQRLTQGDVLNTDSVETSWRITTKYYEVEVEVKSLTLPLDESRTLKDVDFEALVLVMSFHQECSFLDVKQWFEEFGDSRRPSVKCLVMDHEDGESSEMEWIQEAKTWALDHGFESIEVAFQDPELESRLTGEDQGLQRLRSALEAHVWPGYQSTSKGSNPQKTAHEAEEESVDEDQFQRLIVELSSARERIQTLSDRERREAAAEMAMRLAQYFNEDDDE